MRIQQRHHTRMRHQMTNEKSRHIHKFIYLFGNHPNIKCRAQSEQIQEIEWRFPS